ncbi:MAG: TolC family protein [Candidatus Scalinduaceae bacterium]
MKDNINITYCKIGSAILSNWVNIRGRLLYIFVLTVLLNLIIFAGNDAGAKSNYVEALKEILDVAPPDKMKAKEEYAEVEKPVVEFTTEDMKFLNITLKDSIILALHNNYDIRIAKINPILEEKDVTVEKSKFDPNLKITGNRNVSETPTVNQLTVGLGAAAQINEFKQDVNTFQGIIEKPLETGGAFTLDFNVVPRVFIDPAPFNPLNPQSRSFIEVKVTQPILKGAGIFYNRSKIFIARNDKKKSVLQLKAKAIEVINSVQTAYWELVKVIENLRVRNKSLERAKDLLRKNKIQVKVGTLAPIDVLEAEEGVAKQVEGVVVAENEVKNKEDELKQVMNLSNDSILSDAAIIPLDKASFKIKDVSLDESIKIALGNRPELFEQDLEIENNMIEVKRKKNELLPQFDIEAGVRYSGLDGDFGNSIDSVFSERFQSEFFGVTLEVPLGNREARSNYSKAKLEVRQSVLNRSKVEQGIVVDVRKAVRQIKTNIERVRATEKARELAQERLEAEEKKFKVGRTTSLEVVRAQENLAIAEGRATNALVDYEVSLEDLDVATGTILEKNNIIIEDDNMVIKEDLKLEEP